MVVVALPEMARAGEMQRATAVARYGGFIFSERLAMEMLRCLMMQYMMWIDSRVVTGIIR